MNAQFAVRIAVLSGIALVVFAAVFFRLWYLEVLSGDEYLAQSQSNQVREIAIQAPRGKILDSKGRTLVTNRTALSLQVRPDQLPSGTKARNRVLRNLSDVSDVAYPKIKRQIRQQSAILPANPVTLKADVDRDMVLYLRERQDMFPGITAGEVSVRRYPQGAMAAHLFGYVSEIGEELLDEPQYAELDPGDRIGATGLELQYDSDLRGKNGFFRVRVDAFGTPRGDDLKQVAPKTGNNLVLSLDSKVQQAGEQALGSFGKPGAFVAMNAETGAIIAMGSSPSFDPSVFTPPVSTEEYNALKNDEATPLNNRATTGLYPTGSTFKAITAISALESGELSPGEQIFDDGKFELEGLPEPLGNSCNCANGSIAVQKALQVSSNIFFFTLGDRLEQAGNEDLQKWANDLGFGSPTGIDLPGEAGGLVPSPEWRNQLYEDAADPDSPAGEVRDFVNHGETDRPWSVGDSVNLAVGQGDLQADPLQLAVAYAAIANGGKVVRPHLASEVRDPQGRPVSEFDPAPRRELDIAPENQAAVLAGLRDAAMVAGGTSVSVFGGYPFEVGGKTGTAERFGQENQSWYAGIAPIDPNASVGRPQIVVAATVEQGGFGADAAAPVTDAIYRAYFGIGGKEIEDTSGVETTVDGGL